MISLLIALIVLGVVLWLIGTLPLDPTIATLIRVVAVLIVLIWCLRVLAVF